MSRCPRTPPPPGRAVWLATAILLCGSFLSVFVLVVAPQTSLPEATAAYATGGAGLYKNQINWFVWGTSGQAIPNAGLTRTNRLTLGGQGVDVTCTIGTVTDGTADANKLVAYRPGQYANDGLDNLYNVGGLGTANQLIAGVANRVAARTIDFDFSCSASVDGDDYPLDGLVMADAETNANAEYDQATPPAGTTWRIIDRYRSGACANSVYANLSGSTLKLSSQGECAGGGPMAIAFMDNATSAHVQIKGGANSAIALGVVVIGTDVSDAPTSYGQASHSLQPAWSGGTVSAANQRVSDATFGLAAYGTPVSRFGAAVSGDTGDLAGPTASRDSDDGFAADPVLTSRVGATVRQPATCNGTGVVAGWIDWNRDGDFADASEKSSVNRCNAGAVTVARTATSPSTARAWPTRSCWPPACRRRVRAVSWLREPPSSARRRRTRSARTTSATVPSRTPRRSRPPTRAVPRSAPSPPRSSQPWTRS